MEVNKSIFREYDIRGIYPSEVNEEVAYLIGRSFGTKLVEKNIKTTVVGYDNRLSSVLLEESLVKGLMECGIHVIRLGLVTTPMCYYSANYYGCNSSMMITASHNPKEYNGFKFSYNGIHNAYGKEVLEIYELIESNKFANGSGSFENKDIKESYIDLVTSNLDFGNIKIKVVYDPGTGTGSVVAKDIFDKLKDKIDSIGICDFSDGSFPSGYAADEFILLQKQKTT